MIKNRFTHVKVRLLVSLIKNEQGAILLPFIIFLPLVIGLIFFSFELTHFLQKKAKLSDAMEQATLALTVENNNSIPSVTQIAQNEAVVSYYAHAYLPAEIFSVPTIDIINNNNRIEYAAEINMSYSAQFLSNNPLTNLGAMISATDRGTARKNIISAPIEKIDVVFVVDYSTSMDESFNNGESTKKIDTLRRIFKSLNDTILRNDSVKTIGFVPFTWGTKTIEDHAVQKRIYCHFPFVPKTYMPLGDYLKNVKVCDKDTKDQTMCTIENNIDYDKTINSITNTTAPHDFINIPIDDVISNSYCLKTSNAYTLSSDDLTNDNIQRNIEQEVEGDTLVSSGILAGNKLLKESNSTNSNKLMIILSDGSDSGNGITITSTLMEKEMCDKIKENNIRMAFIAIGYSEEHKTTNKSYNIDWNKCVGEGNYYEAYNAHELEASLRQALSSTKTPEVGRNIPKN
ncbi:pilus assembly protein [Yersinia sp. 2540 StPb PI]|uniref:pilus assembly protein n=1 Tax=Yersinia sp. 2540 StPb PI TaxID=3117406 RepID=UPI003FA428EE